MVEAILSLCRRIDFSTTTKLVVLGWRLPLERFKKYTPSSDTILSWHDSASFVMH